MTTMCSIRSIPAFGASGGTAQPAATSIASAGGSARLTFHESSIGTALRFCSRDARDRVPLGRDVDVRSVENHAGAHRSRAVVPREDVDPIAPLPSHDPFDLRAIV